MTEREPALPDEYPVTEAEEFQVAMTQDKQRELYGYLRPEKTNHQPTGAEYQTDQYEQGVIAHITRSTGANRVTFLVEDIVPPENPDDVFIEGRSLKFSAGYRARAKDAVEYDPRKGIAYFHSHPGWSAYPSSPDLTADRMRLKSDAQRLGDDRPFAAGIIASEPRRETGEPEWSVRSYEFNYGDSDVDDVSVTHVTAIRVLGGHSFPEHREGPYLEKLSTAFSARGPAGAGLSSGTVAHDSTLELWGERGQARLSGLRVGVVGCGGVGSLLAEQLARLGVAECVFADFDHLKEANLNRAYGATKVDARDHRPKVEVARNVAENAATHPGFRARIIQGSVVEDTNEDYAALGALLDCDIILNAADPHWVQKVLDRLAYAHLIPVVRGGTDLEISESTDELTDSAWSSVSTAGPQMVCLHCLNVWKDGDLSGGVTQERQPPHERDNEDGLYAHRANNDAGDGSEELRDPSVITTNGLVASVMMERFQSLTIGTTTSTFAGRQVYRPCDGTMNWVENTHGERQRACDDDCKKSDLVALGDYVDLDTGYDHDLREEIPEIEGR